MPAEVEIPVEVTEVAKRLLGDVRSALGERLLAFYLFGSSTTGAFETGVSDVDTVTVLRSDPTDDDLSKLAALHDQFADEAPEWRDRIEVDYVSARALAEFRVHPWPAARISPGEAFHRIQIDRRWVVDWYQVLTAGKTLY